MNKSSPPKLHNSVTENDLLVSVVNLSWLEDLLKNYFWHSSPSPSWKLPLSQSVTLPSPKTAAPAQQFSALKSNNNLNLFISIQKVKRGNNFLHASSSCQLVIPAYPHPIGEKTSDVI